MAEPSPLEREVNKQRRPFRSPYHEAALGLLRTADVLRRRLEVRFQPYGITAQQYSVLRILRGAPQEGLPTMEIAERMLERTPGITRLVDRLEQKGLLARERSQSDRRCVLCTITNDGLRILDGVDEPVASADRGVVGMLAEEEVRSLVGYLDRIRAGGRGGTRTDDEGR